MMSHPRSKRRSDANYTSAPAGSPGGCPRTDVLEPDLQCSRRFLVMPGPTTRMQSAIHYSAHYSFGG